MSIKISIIIKALNEQAHIAAAVESALAAVEALGGEVIVADSCSSDKTVDIAAGYPIGVVTLAKGEERCCGIGAQLGFQHCRGEYVYVLDGDMIIHSDFISKAIAVMDADPTIAGIGGRIVEKNTANHEFESRVERAKQHYAPGETLCLNCGGLYRKSAIDKLGYLTNRNLHAYEEFELAARLRSQGFKLIRLDAVAADHYGHQLPDYILLKKRWKSGYIMGLGELVRSAVGQPHMKLVLTDLKEVRLYSMVCGWMVVLLGLALMGFQSPGYWLMFLVLLVFPMGVMSRRKGSLQLGYYSVVAWVVNSLGMLRGLIRPQVPATQQVDARIIKELWKQST